MEPNDCPKYDEDLNTWARKCDKISMVLDKDLAGDWQYAEVIRAVCAKCELYKEATP